MDIIFKCPKCEQELAVESTGAGSEIECPSCGEPIVIPRPNFPSAPKTGAGVHEPPAGATTSNPIASSAAAKVEMHLRVPVHSKPAESLIAKPPPPLEVTAKESDKKIRSRTIRHSDCIEVGHDRFDEVVSEFLAKVGEQNIISITPINYTHLDIGSQKLMTEYGVFIVYKG